MGAKTLIFILIILVGGIFGAFWFISTFNEGAQGPAKSLTQKDLLNRSFAVMYTDVGGLLPYLLNDTMSLPIYANINGVKYGPASIWWPIAISNKSFGFAYLKNNLGYVRINNRVYGPYDITWMVFVSDDKYGFVYWEKGVQKINLNGVIYTYNNLTGNLPVFTSDGLGVIYRENGKEFITTSNGRTYSTKDIDFKKKLIVGDTYKNEKGEAYVAIADKTYGPFDGLTNHIFISGRNFGFQYEENGKGYVNINGRVYGPYSNLFLSSMTGDGFCFDYSQGNKTYVNIDGQVYGPYDNVLPLVLSEGNGVVYSVKGEWYLNIDGKSSSIPN